MHYFNNGRSESPITIKIVGTHNEFFFKLSYVDGPLHPFSKKDLLEKNNWQNITLMSVKSKKQKITTIF